MDIKVIASSSKGNCYLLTDGKSQLLLECGIPSTRIKQALGFRLSGVLGCLVTHEHKDHSRAILEVIGSSVDCYLSKGTKEALKLPEHHRLHVIKALEQFDIGSWTILPFEAQHDCEEPLSFLIYNKATGDKVVFATDTYYVKYKFKGLTHIMVECNYSLDILRANVEAGLINEERKRRLLKSHFSLDNVIGFLKANDLSKVQEIHLLHLSSDNSNAELFKNKVMATTGLPVYVAEE